MTKGKQYELTIRRIANDILEGAYPESTYSLVVTEDVTTRGEKTIIKKLIHEYSRKSEENKMFGFDNAQNDKILQILNSRLEVVNKF